MLAVIVLFFATVATGVGLSTEPVALNDNKPCRTHACMRLAEHTALQELAPAKQRIHLALSEVNASRLAAGSYVPQYTRNDRQASSARLRWEHDTADLANEAVNAERAFKKRKQRQHQKRIPQPKQEVVGVKEQRYKADRAVQIVKRQHPLRQAIDIKSSVLKQYSKPPNVLPLSTAGLLRDAKAASRQVSQVEKPIRLAVKEKLAKFSTLHEKKIKLSKKETLKMRKTHTARQGNRRSHTKTNKTSSNSAAHASLNNAAIMKQAVSDMANFLKPQDKLVQSGLSAESQRISTARHRTKKQLQHAKQIRDQILQKLHRRATLLEHRAHLAQRKVSRLHRSTNRAVHELVHKASEQHKIKAAKTAVRNPKANMQKPQISNRAALKVAVADMNSVLRPIKADEQAALMEAAKQVDGVEADTARQNVLASDFVPNLEKLRHPLHRALQVEHNILRPVKGQKQVSQELIEKSEGRERKQKQQQRHVLAVRRASKKRKQAREKRRKESAQKAIIQVKTGNNTKLIHELHMQKAALHQARLMESSTLKSAGSDDIQYAPLMHKTSKFDSQAVARAQKRNDGHLEQLASRLVANYHKQHQAVDKKRQQLVIHAQKMWQRKQQALEVHTPTNSKLKKTVMMNTALAAMSKQTKKAQHNLQQGLSDFVGNPVAISQRVLRGTQHWHQEIEEDSVERVKAKADEAKVKVRAPLFALHSRSAELVQKAPLIKEQRKKVKTKKELQTVQEKDSKISSAFRYAREQRHKQLTLSHKSEHAYRVATRPFKQSLQRLIKNAAPNMKNANKAYQDRKEEKRFEMHRRQVAIQAERGFVQKATSLSERLAPSPVAPAWSAPEARKNMNDIVADTKYETSRDGKYNSLIHMMNKPIP